jgi:hypothetical protein
MNTNELLSVRDYASLMILQGLMPRYNEPSYSDKDAMAEAFELADWWIETRDYFNSKNKPQEQK